MKVLLTGSSGHLGGHTARQLVDQGHAVNALVRPTSDLRGLAGLAVSKVAGDVMDAASVLAAAQGCDAIIHQAAVFRMDLDKADDIIKPAVEGTRHMMAAAHQLGIRRVVYTSSIAAIGFSADPAVLLDGRSWNCNFMGMPYLEAKTRSEEVAHELARAYGIDLIVICPTAISGPGDYRLTPTMRMALGLLTGKAPRRAGGTNLVSVADVAKLHVQALTHGLPGGRYVAGGDNVTFDQMVGLLEKIVGHPLPAAPQGKPAPASYSWYDLSDTCSAFDYHPMTAENVLRSVVDWYAALGVYPPKA